MRKTGLIATLLLMCTFIFSANAAETWVKVTEAPESWEGDYLIVTGDYAFDGSLDEASIKSSGNSRRLEVVDDVIITDGCDYYFTLGQRENGKYSVVSASGYYIGCGRYDSMLTRPVDGDYISNIFGNVISFSDGVVDIESDMFLQFEESSCSFNYYERGTNSPIHLYKRFIPDVAKPVISGVEDGEIYFNSVSVNISTAEEDALIAYSVNKDGELLDEGSGQSSFELNFSEYGKYEVIAVAEKGDEKSDYVIIAFNLLSVEAGEIWVKVTEAPESWEGDYLIVTGDYAFDGSLDEASIKSSGNSRRLEVVDDVIITDGCDYYFTLGQRENGKYSVVSASGYYIGCGRYDSMLTRPVDGDYISNIFGNVISFSDGVVDIESGMFLQFKESSFSFNYYEKGSNSPIQLYKRYEKTLESVAVDVSGIAELKDAGAAAEASTVFEMNCPLTVTFSNGDDLYVIDDSGDALLIKGSIGKTYACGEVIPVGAQGCYELIDGFTPAMVNPVGNTFGEPQATVEVTPISVDEITVSDVNKYVKVEDVMVNSTDSGSYVFMASDDGNEIPGWSDAENPYYNGTVSPDDGLSYDVSGIVVVKEGSAALAFTNLEKRIESGVDDLVTGNVMIAGGKCRVIINVPDGNVVRACVYSVSGILFNEEAVTGVSEIELPSGLYIVRIGNQVAKVVVR